MRKDSQASTTNKVTAALKAEAVQEKQTMKPESEIMSRGRWLMEKERDGKQLTAVALESCDKAGLASPGPNPLVETHRRLTKEMDRNRHDFHEWVHWRNGPDRVPIWMAFSRLESRLGRKLSVDERLEWRHSGELRKFVESELEHSPPSPRFFLVGVVESLLHVSVPSGYGLECSLDKVQGGGSGRFFVSGSGKDRLPVESMMLDGTPESFWECAMLLFEFDQFYLYYHAKYNKRFMVFDLRSFLGGYDWFGTGGIVFYCLTEEERKRLFAMSFAPVLEPCPGGFNVYYTIFSPFGGFFRIRDTIELEPAGFSVKSEAMENIEYSCGVHF